MQFITAVISIAALVLGVSASPIKSDPHIADFRLFGEKACFDENEGVWTVLHSDLNKCTSFNGETVKSVLLTDINKGCKLWIYCDEHCSSDKTQVHTGTEHCRSTDKEWKSWKLKC
ncbi:hypothetical protein AK830_g7202 [Neonectria ditissima]|uniref:Cyanovirin-N domain-containing protein n=1 Tax=Neonectria ditissima TaxID=78410 RepID=A0A0P7BAN2_9HYPO|nr:hypothetical protein AK830_g7202 [Neonectria ditissima]